MRSREVFVFAQDGSGDLDGDEFTTAMNALGFTMSDGMLKMLMSRFDADGTGAVDYVEFLRFFCPEQLKVEQLEPVGPCSRPLQLRGSERGNYTESL